MYKYTYLKLNIFYGIYFFLIKNKWTKDKQQVISEELNHGPRPSTINSGHLYLDPVQIRLLNLVWCIFILYILIWTKLSIFAIKITVYNLLRHGSSWFKHKKSKLREKKSMNILRMMKQQIWFFSTWMLMNAICRKWVDLVSTRCARLELPFVTLVC